MRFLKKILSFVAGCVLICECNVVGYVSAEEAPHDIKLTCETKYIDIDEIPEDRVVKLAVSIDNNPGFQLLCALIEVDPRLEYDYIKRCEIVDVNDDVGCINFHIQDDDSCQTQYDIFANSNVVLYRNDTLMNLIFEIPDSAQIGDFYEINILKEGVNGDTYICLEREGMAYGPDSFSELNGGGIHITGDQPLQVTEPTSKQVPENNEKQSEENNTEQPNEHENNIEVKPEVSNEITSVTSPSTTLVITTAPKTTFLTTTPSTYAVTTATIETSEPVTVGIAEKSNDKEKEENKKEIDKTLLIVFVIIVVAIGGSLYIFIKRSKTDKHEK